MSFSIAVNLLDSALFYGGGTVNRDGEKYGPDEGFAVGGIFPSLVLGQPWSLAVATCDAVAEWLDKHPSSHYGSWVDEDGTLYIDAVSIVSDERGAVELGRLRGEKCVWDFANQQEVKVQ